VIQAQSFVTANKFIIFKPPQKNERLSVDWFFHFDILLIKLPLRRVGRKHSLEFEKIFKALFHYEGKNIMMDLNNSRAPCYFFSRAWNKTQLATFWLAAKTDQSYRFF
jgi:hypothetical protein